MDCCWGVIVAYAQRSNATLPPPKSSAEGNPGNPKRHHRQPAPRPLRPCMSLRPQPSPASVPAAPNKPPPSEIRVCHARAPQPRHALLPPRCGQCPHTDTLHDHSLLHPSPFLPNLCGPPRPPRRCVESPDPFPLVAKLHFANAPAPQLRCAHLPLSFPPFPLCVHCPLCPCGSNLSPLAPFHPSSFILPTSSFIPCNAPRLSYRGGHTACLRA
jgi:hypothetical protein